MTTVVTGGAGFLGRRVIARLLDSGEDVVSLDVAPRSVESRGPACASSAPT
jgi:nucleoside-diphosphate-sugar epimerase